MKPYPFDGAPPERPSIAARHEMVMQLMAVPVVDDEGNETGETYSLITPEQVLELLKFKGDDIL